MPITVDEAYIETFQNNIIHLAQQRVSKLRGKVMEVNKQSEAHNWDRMAESVARDKTSPRMVSPSGGNASGAVGTTNGLSWTRRKSLISTFDTGEIVDRENVIQMLIDPKSTSSQNLVMNMNRKVDDKIIAALGGASRDGDGAPVAYNAAQVVGTGAEVISMDMLLETKEVFVTNDVEPMENICLVIGPTQQRKLMQLLEVTSGDYQNSKALATGYLPNFLGFDIIVTNRLVAPDTGELDCFAFTKQGVGLHVASDISSRAAERTDMSFSWQLYCDASMGAIRVEDEHVVKLHLKDSLT